MITILLVFLYGCVLFCMVVFPPVLWAMKRLRIIYPVTYFIFYWICQEHKSWFVTRFLDYQFAFGDGFSIGDLLFYAVLILSAASLLKELIQMVFKEFTWSGLIGGVISGIWFAASYPFTGEKRRRLKEQRESEEQWAADFADARENVYAAMPDMEREYYYFKSICETEEEYSDFEEDWECYIAEADRYLEEGSHYTFDMWFGDHKKWKTRTYYKDFLAREHQQMG